MLQSRTPQDFSAAERTLVELAQGTSSDVVAFVVQTLSADVGVRKAALAEVRVSHPTASALPAAPTSHEAHPRPTALDR